MAKEIAIGKRAKISEAQQYMLLSVLGAAVFLGAGVSLVSHFVQQIAFNAEIIAAEEQSIVAYSDAIKTIGVCESPKGSIYSDAELNKCDPDSIETSQVPGTLRANILENLATNSALNSVPKEGNSECVDTEGKPYTYKELNQMYKDAIGADALRAAANRIKNCSALRIIPDALPAFQNEEALLSSLNKLFIVSEAEPRQFGSSDSGQKSKSTSGIHPAPVRFSFENLDTNQVTTILRNIERSIREFDINKITLEYNNKGSDFNLSLSATDTNAYYMDASKLNETTVTIEPEDN